MMNKHNKFQANPITFFKEIGHRHLQPFFLFLEIQAFVCCNFGKQKYRGDTTNLTKFHKKTICSLTDNGQTKLLQEVDYRNLGDSSATSFYMWIRLKFHFLLFQCAKVFYKIAKCLNEFEEVSPWTQIGKMSRILHMRNIWLPHIQLK